MKPDKIVIALDNLSLEMMEVALVMAQEGGEMAKRGFVLSDSAEMVRGWMCELDKPENVRKAALN